MRTNRDVDDNYDKFSQGIEQEGYHLLCNNLAIVSRQKHSWHIDERNLSNPIDRSKSPG